MIFLSIFVLFLLAIVLIVLVYNLFKYIFFPTLCIVGDSMYPTLKSGELYNSKRIFFKKSYKYKVGNIYVFFSKRSNGEKVTAIKRLTQIDSNNLLWFEGDNSTVSYDSRAYGYVSPECVIAEVTSRKRGDI